MTNESSTHRCTVDKYGYIKVDRKAKPTARITEFSGDRVSVTTRPASELLSDTGCLSNEFTANYKGNGYYNADINCGCQRWLGIQSGKAISRALRVCGFDTLTRDKIMRAARKVTHSGIARQY
jgi:hypothetical protein